MTPPTDTTSTATLYSVVVDSPVGALTILATDAGVRSISWPADEPAPAVDAVERPDHPVLAVAVRQLAEYFAGRRTTFDVPLDAVGTPFQQQAWKALTTIPYGETISYGEQAERLGDRRKARAVGAANGKNPIPIVVPCHRVVGSSGALTGFAGGVDTKAWLLDHERATAGHALPLGD